VTAIVNDSLATLAMLDGVFETVEAARASVDSLLRELRGPGLRSRVREVTAESVRRSAWASVTLEGPAGPVERFQPPFQEPLPRNVFALYAELGSLASTFAKAPGQALAHLHARAAADLVPSAALGRPRTAQAAARLEGLSQLLETPTAAPAVVTAAIAHGEVLASGAFGGASGVVARLVSRCVLIGRGLDPLAVSVPEEGHVRIGREAYDEALAAYRSGRTAGVAHWLAHCAEAVAVGGEVGREVARSL
jgi:hypothetical protein